MSRTLSIACTRCRKHLWIAQGQAGFYSGEPKTMEALKCFLFAHEGHPLIFADNIKTDISDFDEIKAS